MCRPEFGAVLGGSWVVISGVISRVTIVVTHFRGLIVLLITTHEPPSRGGGLTGCQAGAGSRAQCLGV